MRRFYSAYRARIEISPSWKKIRANIRYWTAKVLPDRAAAPNNEKKGSFGRVNSEGSSNGNPRWSSGPPVMQNLPGVSHRTGGWRIPIRACIRPRSGKVGNRSPYKARIEDGPDIKKRFRRGRISWSFQRKKGFGFFRESRKYFGGFFKIFFRKTFRFFLEFEKKKECDWIFSLCPFGKIFRKNF